MRVLLGITESPAVAAVPRLAEGILNAGHELQIVSSIFPPQNLLMEKFLPGFQSFDDRDEESRTGWLHLADGRIIDIHYYPRFYDHSLISGLSGGKASDSFDNNIFDWPDVYAIAPLSIESLAEIASGLTGNLVTALARYHDPDKPFIVAPAIDKRLWTHPITQEHLAKLEGVYRSFKRLNPAWTANGKKDEKLSPTSLMAPAISITQAINSAKPNKNRRG